MTQLFSIYIKLSKAKIGRIKKENNCFASYANI